MIKGDIVADKKTLELQIKIAAEQAAQVVRNLSNDFKKLAQNAKSFTPQSDSIKSALNQAQNAAQKAATSFKLFGTTSGEVKQIQVQLKSSIVDLVNSGLSPQAEEVKNLTDQYKKLEDQSDTLEAQETGILGVFNKLKSEIGSLATVTAAVKVDQVVAGLASNAIEAADSFQTARNEWGVLLGDMEAGAAVFDTILKPFNDKTPFELDTVDQAAKVLRSAKVEVSSLTEWLTRFGDMSQGSAQKMQSFTNAFSKASAKGKADMEVLNVYIDQGVQILDALAKQSGTTADQIVKMASEGKISFTDFQSALESMTNAGGQYYGGMELASKSYKAMQEGLNESVKSLSASLGQILLPAATKVIEVFTNIVNTINDSPLLKGILVGAITALTVAINVMAGKALVSLIAKFGLYIAKTWAAYAAQMGLNSAMSVTNPLLLAGIAAVGVATAAYVAYATSQEKAEAATNATSLAVVSQCEEFEKAKAALKNLDLPQLSFNIESTKQALKEAQEKLEKLTRNPNEIRIDITGQRENEQTEIELLTEQIAQLKLELEELNKVRLEKGFTTELEKGNDILNRRNELYAKTREYQEKQLKEQLSFAKSLQTMQTLNSDGTRSGFDQEKTQAIINYAQQALDDFYGKNKNTVETLGTEWTKKLLTGIDKITTEEKSALDALATKAEKVFGEQFTNNLHYQQERLALEKYYQNQIDKFNEQTAKEEYDRILNQHQERLAQIKEEFEYRKELAREQIESGDSSFSSYKNYTEASAQSAIAETELGQIMSGANPLTQLIDAFLEAVLAIESVNEVLNWATTIVTSMMTILEPLIDSIFKPFSDILKDIGEILGQILAPVFGVIAVVAKAVAGVLKILLAPLQAVGDAFEWLYNKVIVPVGNLIIDVFNVVIDALNKIPFVDIDRLDNLELVGEAAEELSEEIEYYTAAVTSSYEALIDNVQDLLSSQIDSLRSQYELGLITREQYNTQASSYRESAEAKIYNLEKEMAATLEKIENNTYSSLDDAQKAVANQTNAERLSEEWGASAGWIGEVAGSFVGGIEDVGEKVWDGITDAAENISDWVDSWWPFASGTSDIPLDMPAMVHKGEGIIPKTFNDAIKSGEYALVGSNGNSGSSTINVSINVEGSVATENQLIDIVYNGIARAISGGSKTPLPGAA